MKFCTFSLLTLPCICLLIWGVPGQAVPMVKFHDQGTLFNHNSNIQENQDVNADTQKQTFNTETQGQVKQSSTNGLFQNGLFQGFSNLGNLGATNKAMQTFNNDIQETGVTAIQGILKSIVMVLETLEKDIPLLYQEGQEKK